MWALLPSLTLSPMVVSCLLLRSISKFLCVTVAGHILCCRHRLSFSATEPGRQRVINEDKKFKRDLVLSFWHHLAYSRHSISLTSDFSPDPDVALVFRLSATSFSAVGTVGRPDHVLQSRPAAEESAGPSPGGGGVKRLGTTVGDGD